MGDLPRLPLLNLSPTPSTFRLNLGSVVWNDRVTAVTVDEVVPSSDDEAGRLFVDQLPQEVRVELHVMVGTASEDIRPSEAYTLVNDWRKDWRSEKLTDWLQLTSVSTEGCIREFYQ